jgi:hypothetical protein
VSLLNLKGDIEGSSFRPRVAQLPHRHDPWRLDAR